MPNYERITLKKEDQPAPPDLQTVMIELSELLDTHAKDADRLRDLMTRWGASPVSVCQRAQSRTVELSDQASHIRDLVEQLAQAYRAAGAFSAAYTDVEVHDGR